MDYKELNLTNSKLEEFGYIKNGKKIKDYKIPQQEGYYEKR